MDVPENSAQELTRRRLAWPPTPQRSANLDEIPDRSEKSVGFVWRDLMEQLTDPTEWRWNHLTLQPKDTFGRSAQREQKRV